MIANPREGVSRPLPPSGLPVRPAPRSTAPGTVRPVKTRLCFLCRNRSWFALAISRKVRCLCAGRSAQASYKRGSQAGRCQAMRFPMFGGLWPIRPRDALRDAFAGLTLASMNIPQVLGLYAHRWNAGRRWPPYRSSAPRRVRGVRHITSSRRGGGFGDGCDFCEFALAHGRTSQRPLHGARWHGRATDRRSSRAGPHFQARISRRLSVAHCPGWISHRRPAENHTRCRDENRRSAAPPSRTVFPQTALPADRCRAKDETRKNTASPRPRRPIRSATLRRNIELDYHHGP